MKVVGTLALTVLVGLLQAEINPKVCLPAVEVPQDKPFPSIPNSFSAKFAWNMMIVNTTYYIEEVFSEELDKGYMLIENMVGPGIRSQMITYGRTGQYLFINDYDGSDGFGTECQVSALTPSDFTFPFKNIKGNDTLVSGKDVLLLGASNAFMIYEGKSDIDDIDVDVWNGCLYMKDTGMTYNATYSFTATNDDGPTWQTASGLPGTIKRIHLVGNNAFNNNTSEMTYEYVYFDNVIPTDDASYEPPAGAYCEGRKSDKKLPSVPSFFSAYIEVFDPQQNLITFTDEYYDFMSNLTRMDYEGLKTRDMVAKPHKMIHDFQTGISYNIDKYKGTCEINGITGDEFDNEYVPGAQSNVRMRSPREFFNFEDSEEYPWIWQGMRKQRGVDCQVWISKRPYPTIQSGQMAYWEWYFTSADWKVSNGDVLERLEPFLSIISIIGLDKQVTRFSFYKFNQEPPNQRYFSVAECFDKHNESRSYEFVMRADVKKYNLDGNVNVLRYWVASAIEAFTAVRSVRVHDIQFEFADKRVLVRFTLLGKAKIKGDVKTPINETSLEQADGLLTLAIQKEDFVVYYLQKDGRETEFPVFNDSLARVEYRRNSGDSMYYVIDHDGRDQATAAPEVQPAAVSSGAAAGLAIVMMIVGALMVAIPCYLLVVRRKAANAMNSYTRSQLTMEDVNEEQ